MTPRDQSTFTSEYSDKALVVLLLFQICVSSLRTQEKNTLRDVRGRSKGY